MILNNESMRKKNEYEFQMWKLLALYKENLDLGREYLYQHMSVFSNVKHTLAIWPHAKDIYNDIFMVIDGVIQKSIDVFDEKQIYKYIKTRIRWELTNRTKKYWDEINQKQIPTEDSHWEFVWKSNPLDDINDEYLMSIVSDEVFDLEEPFKTIIILHHLVRPKKTFKQIWIALWTNEQAISADYNRAIKILQSKLKDEDLY